MRLVRSVPVLAATLLAAPPIASAQSAPPEGWRWATDRPARLLTGPEVPDSAWRFVAMPPGWHITTGPALTLYDPANRATGRYALEAEIFLFPGRSPEGYGLFIGGRDLESGPAGYLAFLVRRDGRAAVERRWAGAAVVAMAWTADTVVTPHSGSGTSRQVLRVEVEPDSLVFLANGTRVAALPRGDVDTDGVFGFRIGAGVNLHVGALDLTRRLAPPRRR